MDPQAAGVIGGGLLIIANVSLFWIREWLKQKALNKNGKDLKVIKDDVKSINGKIGCLDDKMVKSKIQLAEIKTAVNAQKSNCTATIKRFDKVLGDQNQSIIDLAGRKQ